MKIYEKKGRRHLTIAGSCIIAVAFSSSTGYTQEEEDDVFELSPFTVEAGEDAGYRATSTMAGTRIRTDLRDVGSAISVITEEFLRDTGSTDSESLLVYTTGTEVGGVQGNYGGFGSGSTLDESESQLRPNTNTRVRGLASAENTRDFFITDAPWDAYNVGRVELQRGPNSILFGLGSPAGIINTHTKRAFYGNERSVEVKVDQHGSLRTVLDLNQTLFEDQLAARFIYLNEQSEFQQDHAFEDDSRVYLTAKFDPKALQGESWSTSLQASYENGDIESNRPRVVPPKDRITPWFEGMDQATFNPLEAWPDGVVSSNPYIGEQYGGAFIYFDDPNSAEQFTQNGVSAFPSEATGRFDLPSSNPTPLPFARMMAVNGYGSFARESGLQYQDSYKDKVLTDSSVFNFYDTLLDGETKRENRDFEVVNLALTQSFMGNKFGYELVYNDQSYSDSQNKHMLGDNASIQVDINTHFLNGEPNPNVGRAYVSNRSTYTSTGVVTSRENVRFTGFADFDFRDIMDSESLVAKILGRQTFTGLLSESTNESDSRDWAIYALGTGFTSALDLAANVDPNRELQIVSYLSGDLRSASSASGLNIPTISVGQMPNGSQSVGIYDIDAGTWLGSPFSLLNATQGAESQLYRGARIDKDEVESQAIVWQGKMLDGALVPTIGLRTDEASAWTTQAPSNPATGTRDADSPLYVFSADPYNVVEGSTNTYSLVGHVPESWTEGLGGIKLSLFWNESENFQPAAGRIDALGNPLSPPSGETTEMGFMVSSKEDRLSLKVNWYETISSGAATGVSNLWFLGAVESRAWVAAKRFEAGLTGLPEYAGPAFNYGTMVDGTFVQTDSDRSLQETHVDAVLGSFNNEIATAWGWGNPPDSKWQNSQWDPWSSGGFEPPGITGTSDTKSEGVEIELFFRPTENWDIMFNASKTEASRTNTGGSLLDWVESRNEIWNGTAGDIRMWDGTGTDSIANQWNGTFYNNWTLLRLLDGLNVDELREWRANLVTNYRFSDGRFNGLNIGGSFRWEDDVAIGYPPSGNSFDIENPYMGPAEEHVDLWVGYGKSIMSDSVDWRIQLNIKDVFGSDELIELTRNPDGSMAGARIAPNRLISVSNTFEF